MKKTAKDLIVNSWKPEKRKNTIIYICLSLIIIGIFYSFYTLSNKVITLSQNLDSLTIRYSSTTESLRSAIDQTRIEMSVALNQEKQNVEQKLGNYQNQVGNITNTVTNLQKLSRIDTELLQKYSKVFFLNEHYAPAQLSEIPSNHQYNDSKHLKLEIRVIPFLERMISDAAKEGITLYVFSAYRSFNEQNALKGQYSIIYGAGTANTFSADQGYSEHQLGTTVDFTTTGLGGSLDGFENTKAYDWLINNAYRYGFTLSYPQNNSFYVYEPWHWRFVGVMLATDLRNSGKHFYDLEQRKIDEYLISFFD